MVVQQYECTRFDRTVHQVAKMVNFMSCVFYHNFKKQKNLQHRSHDISQSLVPAAHRLPVTGRIKQAPLPPFPLPFMPPQVPCSGGFHLPAFASALPSTWDPFGHSHWSGLPPFSLQGYPTRPLSQPTASYLNQQPAPAVS